MSNFFIKPYWHWLVSTKHVHICISGFRNIILQFDKLVLTWRGPDTEPCQFGPIMTREYFPKILEHFIVLRESIRKDMKSTKVSLATILAHQEQ